MLDKTFEPAVVEPRCYALWEASGAFAADPDSNKAPYTIMMPPPNVTGSLHIGHALNYTLQDVLIRYQRMRGRDVLWQPGTDHAGIATQMVVERPAGRAGRIDARSGPRAVSSSGSGSGRRSPAARSPASCAASAPRWTGSASASRWTRASSAAVRKVFVALYREGLIYRDKRLVNWDPELQTAISDLEVESREIKGSLVAFPLSDRGRAPGRFIVVATTRPETMLGDTAVAVHPDDARYADLVGKYGAPAAGRPADPDHRRRLCRPGEGHRRGEDHPGARFQRFRGRPAPRPRR